MMIDYLKEQIVYKAGREIRNRGDCEYLSRLIEIETGEYINYNTLRRFFGIDKQKVKPRKLTLNILSNYIGYFSYDHLTAAHPYKLQFNHNQKVFELLAEYDPKDLVIFYNSLNISDRINYLIQVCRYGLISKQIEKLCLTLDMMKIKSDTFTYDEVLYIGNSIGIFLRNIKLPKIDWKKLLNNEFFNTYVFEIFVDYSSLNTSYKIFLQHPIFHKQQEFFKFSVKCLRDYLNLKKLKSFNHLLKQREQTTLNPILEGRFLSLNLYHNKPVLERFQTIENITVEHLYEPITATIITSNFELYEFINHVFPKHFKSNIYRHFHYYQVYLLMKSCYFYKSKLFSKAKLTLKEVTPDDFRLSYKDLLSFFYYLLDFKLYKNKSSRSKAVEISQKLAYKRFDSVFIDDY